MMVYVESDSSKLSFSYHLMEQRGKHSTLQVSVTFGLFFKTPLYGGGVLMKDGGAMTSIETEAGMLDLFPLVTTQVMFFRVSKDARWVHFAVVMAPKR